MKNILILNGSPKGEYSITLQTCLFLQKKFPEYDFDFLHIGPHLNALQKDFTGAREKIEKADLLIFSYPVYTFLAPSQLHYFISMMKNEVESGKLSLKNKFATQITTSKHFYDITAHEYVRENCIDMDLNFLEGLSADMDDLPKEKGQKEAVEFFKKTLFLAGEGRENHGADNSHFKVALVADFSEGNENLKTRVDYFLSVFPYETELVDISKIGMKAGCLGCFNCASDGKCVYNDGYEQILREKILPCDAQIYAFRIQDHSMGSLFKRYDDRQFCNGHRTLSRGKSLAYIIDGDLEKEPNVKTLLRARSQVGGMFLAGLADGSSENDGWRKKIDDMSAMLSYALENHYCQSPDFYGVGGMKIFRDLIYVMGGMMKADYKFFKKEGLFDFPQKQKGTRFFMKLVGLLMTPKMMKKAGNKMKDGMLLPYKKALKNADNKRS